MAFCRLCRERSTREMGITLFPAKTHTMYLPFCPGYDSRTAIYMYLHTPPPPPTICMYISTVCRDPPGPDKGKTMTGYTGEMAEICF